MEDDDYFGVVKYFTLKGFTPVEILKELESTLGIFIFPLTIVEEMVVRAQNYFRSTNEEVNEMTDCQLKKKQKRKEEKRMERSDYYIIIRYFALKGLNMYDIHGELTRTLKGHYVIPSLVEIKKIIDMWKKYIGLNKLYKIVTDIVIYNYHLTLEEIAEMVKQSPDFVSLILTKRNWVQLSGHWVPSVPISDLRCNRVQVSKDCLKYYIDNQEDFLYRFVTFYEISFYYTPETEQFTNANSSSRTETVPCRQEVKAIIFWNSTGIVLTKYTQNIETIRNDYLLMLEYLKTAVVQRQPQVANKTLILQQVNNSSIYTSEDAIQKCHDMQYILLPHPIWSPDLAANNFHLLPNLRKWSANQKFTSYEQVQIMVNNYFLSVPKCEYESSIVRLKYRWHYCVHLQGGYLQP